MEVIAIGKPAINIYLPLQEYPIEGETFNIKNKVETLGNVSAVSACLLCKWGIKTNFTGVLGNDGYAEKVRNILAENKVQTKYLETNFQTGTATNSIILNTKIGAITKIKYNDESAQLLKHKYDFTPEFAILDGTDYSGDIALMNNYGHIATTLMYVGNINPDILSVAKRCSWLVLSQSSAEAITRIELDGTQQACIDVCQKLVDTLGKSNFIVILQNRKILYSIDGQVKLVPEMKMNNTDPSSFESIFTGALAFALINKVDLDNAIKFADTAAAISLGKIGEETAIPDISEVLENSGLQEKINININVTKKEVTPNNDNTNIITGNIVQNEVAPNPQTAVTQPQMPVSEPTVNAFNQSIVEQPVQPELPQVNQVAQPQPTVAPQTQQVQSNPQPQVEQNMFDNPDINMFDNV